MNLGYLLAQWADSQSDKVALVFGDLRLTYGEMDRRVNALCHAFSDFGLGKGDRVAVLTYNCHQFMEIFFACGGAGMIMVPLNFRLVGRELEYQLNNSGSALLFLGEEFQKVIESIRPKLGTVKKYFVIGKPDAGSGMQAYEQLVGRYPQKRRLLPYEVSLEDEFIIIYTAGTTGLPKGALLTQMNVLFTSINQIIGFQCTTRDKTLTMSPMFHVGGSLVLTLPIIHVGGTTIIMKTFDPAKALELIQKEKITVLFGVPAMWTAIMQVPGVEKADFSSLRVTVSRGASQPVAILKKINQTFHVPFTEGYGLSEASSCSSVLMWDHALKKAG